jgi:phage terminase large subunit-like protein
MKGYERYIKNVLANKIIVGNTIRMAIDRHIKDLTDGDKRGLFFNVKKADAAIEFIQMLRHHKGEKAGTPIMLEDHQQFYIASLFGWQKKNDKGEYKRRFKRSYKEVGRKNGKTTELAGLGAMHITCDGEFGAQVYCGATKEDQAMITVDDASKIIQATPYLKDYFSFIKKGDRIKRAYSEKLNGFITAIGRDSKTQDGYDPSMGIIDEYHEHKDNKTVDVIESGMGARSQPMLSIITTAGFNKQGPCFEFRKNCIDILNGTKEDDATFAMIFAMDEDDDWTEPSNWIKSNPNLGVSVNPDFMRDRFKMAMNEGGTKEVDFKTKNLNMWVDAAKVWIKDEYWRNSGHVEELPDVNTPLYCSLDLGSTSDVNALTVMWLEDGKFCFKNYYWIPEDTVDERQKFGIYWRNWVKQGYIYTTPGNVTDYHFIEYKICELLIGRNIQMFAYDRWNSTEIIINLTNKGFNMYPFGQGFSSMSSPTKEFERLMITRYFKHDNNPVTQWMLSNVYIHADAAGNVKPDKKKSQDKIDGIVTIIMALGCYMHDNIQEKKIGTIEVW